MERIYTKVEKQVNSCLEQRSKKIEGVTIEEEKILEMSLGFQLREDRCDISTTKILSRIGKGVG